MKTYFKKVEIHSKKDLPKGKDAYISCSTSDHIGFRRHVPNKKKDHQNFENISSEFWLKNIIWYFQPISEAEQREELREELIKFLNDMDFDITYGLLNNEEIVDKYLKQK
jgi:hypothetical protein